jgi:hypothetical protein
MEGIRIVAGKPWSKNLLKKAFDTFVTEDMEPAIYTKLDEICGRLLLDAVIANRRMNPEAHQFTGNLINSIVVILYWKNEGSIDTYFAYDRLNSPIQKEMSSVTSRGTARKNLYRFHPDWQQKDSAYKPELPTDFSTGPADARSFASAWTPSTGKPFEICVAYTSEYADWVQQHRKSTGYIQSIAYTKKVMASFGFKKLN